MDAIRDPLTESAAVLMKRDPRAALTLDELHDRLGSESRLLPGRVRLLERLRAHPRVFRVLTRPERGWPVEMGPKVWVVCLAGGTGLPTSMTPLHERLKWSLIALSANVEPGSMSSWAWWSRILAEERQTLVALGTPIDARDSEVPVSFASSSTMH